MKNTFNISCLLFSLISLNGCAESYKKHLKDQPDGLYAVLETNSKVIVLELYYQKTPLTVTSFVGLATGVFGDNVERKGNFFKDITFHRVVDNFVVQGGDPTGTGTGGPGYSFPDEFDSSLVHDQSGIVSMANSGSNTNGSQFFITLAPTPHLNNKHSIFGKVVTHTDSLDQIIEGDTISELEIMAKGDDATAFLEHVSWESFQALVSEKKEVTLAQKQETIDELSQNKKFTKTPEGIFYYLEKKGSGAQIRSGDTASIHYELKLYNSSEIIDSSFARKTPLSVVIGQQQVITGWEIILQKLKVGDRALVIIPPELAYGEHGAGGVIPPNAFLEFVIEIVGKE